MNKDIKNKIKKNKYLYEVVKIFRMIQYNYIDRVIFEYKCLNRKLFKYSISQNDLREYKNKHLNERCFIIATGPSLTIEDLKLLKNEITFGMNSICKVFDKLEWETTYYGVQDYGVYDILKDDIASLKDSTVLVGDNLKKRYSLKDEYVQFPLNLLNHTILHKKKYNTVFSEDCYSVVYDGYTITYSLLQIAVYMGFKEIYLIGADCNYSKDINKRNFVNIGKIDNTFDTAGDRMRYAYSVAKEYADKNNIKIYNATRGGMLEVFERVNLEDVLNQ